MVKLMKATASKQSKARGAGTVQVAVWRDRSDLAMMEEALTQTGEVFFDFSRPLQILDSPGWSSQIQTDSDDGFFVFSLNERIP